MSPPLVGCRACGPRCTDCLRLVLRRTLRGHAGRMKAVRTERALQHHLRIVHERIGGDSGISGAHHLSLAMQLEAPVERVALAADVARIAVYLKGLAVPRVG